MNTIKNSVAICFALMSLVTVGCGLQDESESPSGDPSPPCTEHCGTGGSDTGTGGSDAGGNGGSDAGTGGDTTTDAGGGPTTGDLPAPVISPAACLLQFADDYISGSPCGDVVGTLPGMTWSEGQYITDSDSDGRLELKYASIPEGSYLLSYRDRECKNEVPRTNWALYGDPEMLKRMTDEARSFIQCNWWDAANAKVMTSGDPGCKLAIKVGPSCAISGNGNMKNFK